VFRATAARLILLWRRLRAWDKGTPKATVIVAVSTATVFALAAAIIVAAIAIQYLAPPGRRRKRPPRA
jgi:hypothetical protein